MHEQQRNLAFCFLLGAGASKSSNIRTGGELVERWLVELQRQRVGENGPPLAEWATAKELRIKGFDYAQAASFYPQVYDVRFGNRPDEGYAYLENEMKSAEPNLGYSILALILDGTRHKVVITTNFDNLVADAISIFTKTFPLVCGHESLTAFATLSPRRPLIAKVHRDLLFAPQSGTRETTSLHQNWAGALRAILTNYVPIVLGYGGNDGSLMGFLDSLKGGDLPGGIFWCYREADAMPNRRILNLVAKHRGAIVPITGFDEFMLGLNDRLGYELQADAIEKRAKERAQRYRESVEKIQTNLTKEVAGASTPRRDAAVEHLEALKAASEKKKGWWTWHLAARRAKDSEEGERIYRQAEKQFPDIAPLLGNFANFMTDVRENHDEAERLYRRALELDPKHATITGNFAIFMTDVRKDHDEAERLFRRTLELDPENAGNTGNFAIFMTDVRKDHDEAERLFRRALELDPKEANNTGNLARFMTDVRKDHDEAERLFRRALELDSESADITANFASLLLARGKLDEAETMAKRAWTLLQETRSQTGAEIALYRGLIQQVTGRDDRAALGRLRTLLGAGFERGTWSFDAVLAATAERMAPAAQRLYRAIADAILDENAMSALNEMREWQVVTPIDLAEPWP
ncbi:MAG: tetratricopeptide repeat protein [Sedimentisphaerales bacterium]|nr:tetratricopeptide repeat protein [Sedimentisphaerales bacterium]